VRDEIRKTGRDKNRRVVMNRNMKLVAVAMMVVIGLAVPVFAQHSGPVKVKVPFNFVIENERFKAGDYTIEKVANGRLRIQDASGNVSATVLAIPTQGKATVEQGRLVFHRYGSEYFLAKIWTPGLEVGWDLMQGKLETELARRKTPPVQVATLIGH
jgi:hypothetical protein